MYFLQNIKCPYCNKKNTGDDWHGIPYDEKREENTYKCEHCEREFKIKMEFYTFKTSKIKN